ncbi:hypothetical protein [Sodalis sp. dw_96]|uniref:hypothetical protein n=1 Tax=Sodalis sp. dw_96 TaxID=2719794 RepID=UPI001BD5CE6C|nr:hypothetical protein [Sodalis sp. dw_96]
MRSSRRREDTLLQLFRALFDGVKELKLNPVRRRRFINGDLAKNIEAVRVERTHDDAYFPLADRLIKLDAGQIVSDIRQEGPVWDNGRLRAGQSEG